MIINLSVRSSQISLTNIPSWFTAIRVIDRIDNHKVVSDAVYSSNRGHQCRKSDIGADDAIICCSIVVLDLLEKNDVRTQQMRCNVTCDCWELSRSRSKIIYLR